MLVQILGEALSNGIRRRRCLPVPFILVLLYIWKNVGYGMVIYLNAIKGNRSDIV